MSHPHAAAELPPPSTRLQQGWHCLHMYYAVDQKELNGMAEYQREEARAQIIDLLNPAREGAPAKMFTSLVSGHKADLGLMLLDEDPLKIDRLCQELRSSRFGVVLKPTYSFVSITEISEYVPTVEQYGAKLRADGLAESDPAYAAKVNAYGSRLPMMNRQRLYPDIPAWPAMCFYPMNKIRHPLANWYSEPFSSRSAMMSEHATSGIKFAGRVTQLVTASTGLDDWEWGVTLWARSPEYLKDIVYTMRFDQASARYAEFGPFYVSYVVSAEEALAHLML